MSNSTGDNAALLPCPFCGATKIAEKQFSIWDKEGTCRDAYYKVWCICCFASFEKDYKKDCYEAWNNRQPVASNAALMEAAEALQRETFMVDSTPWEIGRGVGVKQCLELIRQHTQPVAVEQIIRPALQAASEILERFATSPADRPKIEEWEACYAKLFTQMNALLVDAELEAVRGERDLFREAFRLAIREHDLVLPFLAAHNAIPKHWPVPELVAATKALHAQPSVLDEVAAENRVASQSAV